jgi:hypothetical protein
MNQRIENRVLAAGTNCATDADRTPEQGTRHFVRGRYIEPGIP